MRVKKKEGGKEEKESTIILSENSTISPFPSQCTIFIQTLMECIANLNDIIQSLNYAIDSIIKHVNVLCPECCSPPPIIDAIPSSIRSQSCRSTISFLSSNDLSKTINVMEVYEMIEMSSIIEEIERLHHGESDNTPTSYATISKADDNMYLLLEFRSSILYVSKFLMHTYRVSDKNVLASMKKLTLVHKKVNLSCCLLFQA